MPVKTFAILLISAIAAAGVTIALVMSFGASVIWLSLIATLAALLVRKVAQ